MADTIISLMQIASNPDVTSTEDPIWNSLVREWLCRVKLTDAVERIGPLHEAACDSDAADFSATEEFGRGWRAIPEAKERFGEPLDRMRAVEEMVSAEYYGPQTEASVALALHPAPNLAAAIFKVDMIEREELHNLLPMPREPWELVCEDFDRLRESV